MNHSLKAPKDQIYWLVQSQKLIQCVTDLQIDVAIVGGGMAGLSAAQAFADRGKKVALFEKTHCGAGATGKSAGFITPNAELSFTDFIKRHDYASAVSIWDMIGHGLQRIENNIKTHSFDCGYVAQDGLLIATSKRDMPTIRVEYENLAKAGYRADLFEEKEIRSIVNSNRYFGGVSYKGSFGVNGYEYCQALKKHLVAQGVLIFEQTEVTGIDDHVLTTPYAKITAEQIVVCVDHFLPELSVVGDQVYHVQSFVVASEPLTDSQIALIYPDKKLMAWDTHLIYNYFRLTTDRRLVLGGGDLFSTYWDTELHNYRRITRKLTNYFYDAFPQLADLQFEYQWSGLIGISKDIAPIAGPDVKYPHIYYASGATGLPIAAALGYYSMEHLLDGRRDMDCYFSPERHFMINGLAQKLLTKKLTFAMSNAWTSSSF